MNTSIRRILPGFNLSLGYTLIYLSLIVLVPLAAAFIKTSTLTLEQFCMVNGVSIDLEII